MKQKLILAVSLALLTISYACKDEFLNNTPVGAYSQAGLSNKAGVDGALITAYGTMRGTGGWYTSSMNWLWGSIRGSDAYKGSEATDQAADVNPVERFEQNPGSGSMGSKWTAGYDGIGQANVVLRLLNDAKDMQEADRKQATAEARFLRGYHHFEVKRIYGNIPFVDEKATTTADFKAITNEADAWPKIMEDLNFAYANLPETQAQLGRVNKWAAAAFVAKALLYQKKWAEAKTVFDAIIANGKTNSGEKFGLLDKYGDVFKGDFDNSKEMVFVTQYTVGDGTQGANSGIEALPFPHNNGPGGCCGFFQPSQNFVNAFKTDATGLPMMDTYNASDVNNFEATPADPMYAGELDPRLDWSAGRIGVPYLDHGPAQSSWIRNLPNGGPYIPMKHVFYKAEAGKYYTPGSWGQAKVGKNWPMIRFADVLLMAAEAEIEAGSLAKAADYVNMVRKRAANPAGFVMKMVDEKDPAKGFTSTPFAKYKISEYPASAFASKDAATKIVRYERRIELGMEGHRFFDLVRWGIADTDINAYLQTESKKRSHLLNAKFTKDKHEFLPIPEYVINQSKTIDGKQGLTQNKGY